MSSKTTAQINVVVDAKRRGDVTASWSAKNVSILAQWDRGSEQEKFEVLNAIRKVYNPEERSDIRGRTGQTPSQIGQSEGFSRLSYQYAAAPGEQIVIVKPLAGYSSVPPASA